MMVLMEAFLQQRLKLKVQSLQGMGKVTTPLYLYS
jgi:hypothetical protein